MRSRLKKLLHPIIRRHTNYLIRAYLVAGFATLICLAFLLYSLNRVHEVFEFSFALLVFLQLSGIILLALCLIVMVSLIHVKAVSWHHLECKACGGELLFVPSFNWEKDKAEEIEQKFPGWKAYDKVPLRCPNCGAWIEDYINEKLAKDIGLPVGRRSKMNWHAVCDKWSEQGYDSLTEPEQIWLNTRGLIDAIENGGIVSFFYNSSADNYEDTTFALGELEAYEVLDILESFGAYFGEEVPYDVNQRNAIISSWKQNGPECKASENVDSLLSPLLDQLEVTLEAYLIEQGLDPKNELRNS